MFKFLHSDHPWSNTNEQTRIIIKNPSKNISTQLISWYFLRLLSLNAHSNESELCGDDVGFLKLAATKSDPIFVDEISYIKTKVWTYFKKLFHLWNI